MMKYILSALLLLVVWASIAQGQDNVSIPVEELLVTVVPQLNCPLKIEDAISIKLPNGRVDIRYRLRNLGAKAVTSYTIAKWYSDNTGEVTTGSMPSTGVLEKNGIAVNIPIQILDGISNSEPASKKTAEGNMIAFVFISDITFADGSKYRGGQTLGALKKQLSRIESFYYER